MKNKIMMLVFIFSFCFVMPMPSDATQSKIKTYTKGQVAKHNSKKDCWLIIHGKVYDVTSFIPRHPGGRAILQGCGKDATQLFEKRPMGSGTPHSKRARKLLNEFYIGELAK